MNNPECASQVTEQNWSLYVQDVSHFEVDRSELDNKTISSKTNDVDQAPMQ